MSPGVYQNNPKYVPDANILKDPCTATYTLGWKRWAGAGNAPPAPAPSNQPISPRAGSSLGPTTVLHLKLNLPPPRDAANGDTVGPSHLEDAWLSRRGA